MAESPKPPNQGQLCMIFKNLYKKKDSQGNAMLNTITDKTFQTEETYKLLYSLCPK